MHIYENILKNSLPDRQPLLNQTQQIVQGLAKYQLTIHEAKEHPFDALIPLTQIVSNSDASQVLKP